MVQTPLVRPSQTERQTDKTLAINGAEPNLVNPMPPETTAPVIREVSERALDIYRSADSARTERFLYLDVKSLPRSGLHFMRGLFEEILRECFSFCEWYTEPGCCKQTPCAVTGYLTEKTAEPHLRMVKSHDFDFSDPTFSGVDYSRRYILVRDPLFILTSWWPLECLGTQTNLLKQHGISTTKINFSHEYHVVRSAMRIVEAEANLPTHGNFLRWLDRKTQYIDSFARKWHAEAQADPERTRIVPYEDTSTAAIAVIDEIAAFLPDAAKERLEAFRINSAEKFQERTGPYACLSPRIADFMAANADHFEQARTELLKGPLGRMLNEQP